MRKLARAVTVLSLVMVAALSAYGAEQAGEDAAGTRFVVELPAPAANGAPASYSGRLFVFLSRKSGREPRLSLNWFKPEPFFACEVRDFSSEQTRDVDDTADGFPDRLSKLPPGKFFVQALFDHDLDHHDPATAPGNLYSPAAELELDPARDQDISLRLSEIVQPKPFPATRWFHEIRFASTLLSEFHQRQIVEEAAVVLPASYFDQPERRYPAIYFIPGFGGSHRAGSRFKDGGPAPAAGETEFIRVFLSGDCKWGHHVFADSATNGPRGEALVRELIPHLDGGYRTIAEPTARFVTGHSSGGWASLWLQVNYPDVFGGVWSTAPDSVDFHDFEQVDLYAPNNLYRDDAGNRRPIARRDGATLLWFDSFCQMDSVLYRGGQMRSFEAVFCPRGADGQPLRMWDRQTGQINPEVASTWRKYDIREMLEQNWAELGPKLAGKIHIWVGDQDTFYLERAIKLLKTALERLGSDARITIVPDRNHGNLLTPDLTTQFRREMSAKFFERHATPGGG